jgi:hypothetical protein
LLNIKRVNLLELESKFKSEISLMHSLQDEVDKSVNAVRPYKSEVLDNLNFTKGLAEGEILQFRTMLEQAENYKRLLTDRSNLEENIERLKSFIYTIKSEQESIKENVIRQIQNEGVYLLNNDLDRQNEFSRAAPGDLILDFSNNLTYLKSSDKEKFKQYQKFSASSNFYLKVSARFAIFLASLSVDKMRFPRFIFADNMEDKGIEEKRAQNLQAIIIDRLNEFKPDNFQLIYTTSYITEVLKNSEYIVGEYYTKSNPSLKNIG